MKKLIGVILVFGFFLTGCATIITGSTQDLKISTSPDHANVMIYDDHNMKVWDSSTPAVVNLKKGDGYFTGASYRIEIEKDGYEKQTIPISSSLNGGWYLAGNFLFGGPIGWLIVDPISGGMWTLKPKAISTDLRQTLSFDDDKNIEGIYVVLKEQIPNYVFENLELIQIN